MKYRIKNPPQTIWLQIGDDIDDDTDWFDVSDVTWSEEQIHDTDIEYRLVRRRSRKTTASSGSVSEQ